MAAQVVEEPPVVDAAKAEKLKAAANAAFQGKTFTRNSVVRMASLMCMERWLRACKTIRVHTFYS